MILTLESDEANPIQMTKYRHQSHHSLQLSQQIDMFEDIEKDNDRYNNIKSRIMTETSEFMRKGRNNRESRVNHHSSDHHDWRHR